jgi:exonuclease III
LRALDRQIDPRKAFIADLKAHVQTLHRSRELIILGGDFNEILGANDTGLISVIRAGNLIDVIHTRHPTDIDVPTYERGNHRIDYHFLSREANEAVLACGAEPFGARIQSDHRGLFLTWIPVFYLVGSYL